MSEIFLKIVNMSISAGYIVLAVLLLRLLLKKAPKWIMVVLWGIVAVRLICPFSFESVLSLIPSKETVSPSIMTDSTPEINAGIPLVNSTLNPIIGESLAPAPGDSVNPLQIWVPVLTAVWVLGMAALLVYTAISYARVRRKIGTAVLLRNAIYQSENVGSPFVLGLIKPKIYLPFNMNEKEMEYVVAHEMAHIHRKDYLWKPLGFLLLTLHWFNPLMWLGYVLLCRDIELACDEKVIKALDHDGRADYSEALLTCSVNRRMIAACPIAFGEVGVKARIKSVLNYKKPAFWIILAAMIACVVVAVCFLTNPPSKQENETKPMQAEISVDRYTEYAGVYISVLSVDKDEGGRGLFNVVWHNDTDKEAAFGEAFAVEQKIAGEWKETDGAKTAFDAIAYPLDPYDAKEKNYILEHFDLSEAGIYRFVVPFSVKEGDEYVSYKTWVLFSVGPAGNMALLRERYPAYFDMDATAGLDVYVWQMAPYGYSFGLLPHSEEPKEWTSRELFGLSGISAAQMRTILSTYNLNEDEIYVIPWTNPISSYLAPWEVAADREDGEEIRRSYAERIHKMLLGGNAGVYGAYVRENKRDIFPFSITLYEDGTYQYFECSTSSHIGVGDYTFENDIITMAERLFPGRSDPLTRTYKFRFEDGKLVFLAEASDDFMYIKLPDGAEFERVE